MDVGRGQMDSTVSNVVRVVRREGVKSRDLSVAHVPESVGAIVADLSFISLTLALPPALSLAVPGAWMVALVKPQFEVGRALVGKGGVVRDRDAREEAVARVTRFVGEKPGWNVLGQIESPITGSDGNVEYLMAARKA